MGGQALLVLGALTALLVVLGSLEAFLHRRVLSRFRVVIQVNGTRGKSSVTRLIAGGLRAGGFRTVAKTTGTLPRLIHPDGTEEPIYRVGRANVAEQLGVMRRALRLGADAVVIECMALQPFLQWISTARLVRPSVGVITNIRADHLDVMGPNTEGVARALAGSVPLGGKLYVGDTRYREFLQSVCSERGSEFVVVRPETAAQPVTRDELAGFSYVEHAENVDLALRICVDLGVPRELALSGMQVAYPDPGALTMERVHMGRESFIVVNAFAANDPESTGQVWELSLHHARAGAKRIALFNCRADRADRSRQLAEAAVSWSPADHYVVTGSGTHFFVSAAARHGLDMSRIVVAEGEAAPTLARRLGHLSGENGLVVGLGNIGGIGLALLDHLRELRAAPLLSAAPRRPSRLPSRTTTPGESRPSSTGMAPPWEPSA
ncbi:MAG TPA: poly-gamma-glutamate synthase PgsB [Polyangiaceae bacterium]|nr:poly-gamma-glutamate synthase PgsB [Polyangiaceae bacterium]